MSEGSERPARSAVVESDLGALKALPCDLHDPAQVLSSLQAQLAHEDRTLRGWLRSRPSSVRYALAALLATVPVTVTVGALRAPVVAPSRAQLATLCLAMGAVVGCAAWLGLRSHASAAWSRARVIGALGLGVGLLALINVLLTGTEASGADPGALACLRTGFALALPVYLGWRVLDRGDNPHGPMLALGAGVSANLALNLHCSGHGALHDLVGHCTVALVLLGVHAIGERWQRASRSP